MLYRTMVDSADHVPASRSAFRDALQNWYVEHRRALPWRETTDPYAILVSEIMSQQTQLSRVEAAWEAFLDRWPTVADLAAADQAAVVAFWSEHSLGYNNRAKYLHTAATQIMTEFDGEVPAEPERLQELHGVGPYTANAVASFAFNNGNAVVDTNVKRILYRLATAEHDGELDYQELADELLPAGESRIWNNAMMELGALVCQQTPRCDEMPCPLREWCDAYQVGDFTAPDVQTQPSFEGSRRQFRGRIIRALSEHGELTLDALGPRIRIDYAPDGEYGREWLRELLTDLEADGLVAIEGDTVQLR